jgi:acyl-CoA thioester hydrolase
VSYFKYLRKVNYYETDMMGVVHHSNHLRYFEESRLAWYNESQFGLLKWNESYKEHEVTLAVVHAECDYKAPLKYNDQFEIRMQLKLEGTKVFFKYLGLNLNSEKIAMTGLTIHVPVDRDMKIVRPSQEIIEKLSEEPWTEIWP